MSPPFSGMRRLPGGRFQMGSDRHYPEERPARGVVVDPFWIDETPVTNAQFSRFVAATGYVSFAEIPPNPADYPGMIADLAAAGSLVFTPTAGPVNLADPLAWWRYEIGACWRRPLGPGSDLSGLEDHPVVHVAYVDAVAYARWVGKALPTEAEWEFAARGGLDGAAYAWGDELEPGGAVLANYWRGVFPRRPPPNTLWGRTSPVGTFPANGFGLLDMIGNVWEWTQDAWSEGVGRDFGPVCCSARNAMRDHDASGDPTARKVLKGGSHLCAESYCQRYRPAARHPQPIDTTTSHVGFRCVAHDD